MGFSEVRNQQDRQDVVQTGITVFDCGFLIIVGGLGGRDSRRRRRGATY